MPGSMPPPRGSQYNPQQCDHETLMCLVGAVEEPSSSIAQPSFVLAGAGHWQTPGRAPLNLSQRSMSLAEWRDRVLTSDEQRVARPVEVAAAMRQGKLREVRSLWTRRIAQQRALGVSDVSTQTVESEATDKKEPVGDDDDDTPLEKTIFLEITRAIEEMGRQFGEAMDQVQLEEDLGEPFKDGASAVSGVETVIQDYGAVIGSAGVVLAGVRRERRMLRKLRHAVKALGRDLAIKVREDEHEHSGNKSDRAVLLEPRTYDPCADHSAIAPPRVPLNNPMPENAEQHHKCGCSKKTRVTKCIYCNDDAVFDGVYDNLI